MAVAVLFGVVGWLGCFHHLSPSILSCFKYYRNFFLPLQTQSALFSLPGVAVFSRSKEGQCMSQRGGSLSCWIACQFNRLCQGKIGSVGLQKEVIVFRLRPEQKKDVWMESAELRKENRKHWSLMICVIYYLNIQQTTWGLNTLFCGNLESWGIWPNLIRMSFGELCFLLRFWFQTKWALAAACIGGTDAAAKALLGTGFLSLLQLSLLMVLSYRNLSWSKGAIKPQTLKRLLQIPHCLGYVLLWKQERAF